MTAARYIWLALICLAPNLAAGPVAANDSSAALESGELQLTRNPDVTLEREDLYLSAREVKVSYRFRNLSDKDVVTLVAFPMPPIEVGQAAYSIDPDASDNFIDFRLWVDGKELKPKLQLRATRFGVDLTDVLEKYKLPVLPFGDAYHGRFKGFTEGERAELERAGLVDWSTEHGPNNTMLPNPHWEAHATYYWEQTFSTGKITEIAHSYRPVPAVSFYGSYTLENEEQITAYCLDEDTEALQVFFKTHPEGTQRELFYILTTANNWQGEIGEFNLTIDKGKPETLVSLCFDGMEKTGPATFKASLKDFTPEQDLEVLFLEPHKKR